MALPLTRNTNYVASSPIKSVDLNDIQDCIIEGGHGDKVLQLSPHGMMFSDVAPGLSVVGGPGIIVSTGAGDAGTVPLHVGDRIKDVSFQRFGDGGADITNVIVTLRNNATITVLGSSGAISPGAAWVTTPIAVTDTVLVAGDSIFVEFVFAGAGAKIATTSVTYDHPL